MAKIFSNKKGIRQAKEVAGGQQHTAIDAIEGVKRAEAIAMANERAKMAVWGLLGQPGTYGNQNQFTQNWENKNNVDDPTSLFDTTGLGLSQPNQALASLAPNDPAKNSLLGKAREGILDPESYANAIAGTAQFRIQSQRVAESEQLLNQEGPAWDMLENSVLGTIREGSALQFKDTVRKLKNQYAKGGTARRAAMYEVQELAAMESATRMKVQETWQANLKLFEAVRQNADHVAAGTQNFMAGLPLVNDAYRNATLAAAELNIKANEFANTAIQGGYDTRMTQQPKNVGINLAEGLIKLVPTAVGSLFGPGGAAIGQQLSGVMGAASSGGGFSPRPVAGQTASAGGAGGGAGGGGEFDYGAFGDTISEYGEKLGGKLGLDKVGDWVGGLFS